MIQKIRKSLPYLLPVLVIILIFGLILSRVYSPGSGPPNPEVTITADQAAEYTGTVAEVCGRVKSANFLHRVGGQPTFLNFGEPHPNQLFTAVIWGNKRELWRTPPEEAYLNQNICVSGRIQLHDGTPQIEVEFREQIRLNEEE